MKITVYTDLHLGAPHGMHEFEADLLKAAEDENTFFTGDIFDMKNTRKSKVAHYRIMMEKLKIIAGDRYIIGNHECEKPKSYFTKKQGVLFTHGHKLKWSEKRIKKWENKEVGKGKLGYLMYRFMHLFMRRGKNGTPSKKLRKKCERYCKEYGCHTIIYGHTHQEYDGMYKDIRIVNVPRGRTVLDVQYQSA